MFFHFQNDFPFFEHLKISLKVVFLYFFNWFHLFLVFSNFLNWFLFFLNKWKSVWKVIIHFRTNFQFFFVFFFYFLNWYSLFWINENEFEKLFPIFWTDFLFPVFFSLLKWLMKISLKSFNFRINWWNFFISKKWILAPKTSKKYNRQKWNLLSSRSPLSKIMSILLFLIKSSLFSWFFVTFVGTNSFLLLFYYRQLFFALHFLFFDFNFSFFAFLFFQLSVFFLSFSFFIFHF